MAAAAPGEVAADKGRELMRSAEKELTKFSLFNKAARHETAMEMFQKAGAQFKIAKLWHEAAQAYEKAAEQAEKSGNDLDSTNLIIEAAKAWKQGAEPAGAARCYDVAVRRHMDNNRFSMAAKLYKELASIHESEMRLPEAIAAYSHAADCYMSEDSQTSAHQCLLKVADYSAQSDDFKRAIDIYERVAQASLDNNLTKWSVSQYLFKAGLCHLVLGSQNNDVTEATSALEKYKEWHAQFEGSRECKFLEDILKAWEDKDTEKFTDVVFEYDQISKLDPWKSGLLLAIKNHLKASGDVVEPDEPDFTN